MDAAALDRAAAHLNSGGLILFPTETVFGIGCDAHNEQAVRALFAAKNRPQDKPLALHLAPEFAQRYAAPFTPLAQKLIDQFLPGPLTLVVEPAPDCPPFASAGAQSVGLRCPSEPHFIQLARALGRAIAGTSANESGEPPALTPQRARDYFPDESILLIDPDPKAPDPKNIPSTVVSLLTDPPTILREGAIPASALPL